MSNQSDEAFGRRFAWLLAGVALTALWVGFWFERQFLLRHKGTRIVLSEHDEDYHPWNPVPPPPQWVKEVPPLPEWWNEVVVTNYDERLSAHNKYERQKAMEKIIDQKVVQGISPVRERRELIKYLSLWADSPTNTARTRITTMGEMARAYEKLGDYKMTAKLYSDLVLKYGREWALYSLAFQYERGEDNKAALEIYDFMIDSYRNGSEGRDLGKVGKSRLGVVSNDCVLKKPEWWGKYDGDPDWWTNEVVELPKFTSFWDGLEFIVHKWGKEDPRRAVKGLTALFDLKGTTSAEREMATSLISYEYSVAGDHHRAIETKWKIPGRLAHDPFICTNALDFIAREFDVLGETNHAKEIRDAIPCFSKWPRDIVRK